jgi:hypothetical protein
LCGGWLLLAVVEITHAEWPGKRGKCFLHPEYGRRQGNNLRVLYLTGQVTWSAVLTSSGCKQLLLTLDILSYSSIAGEDAYRNSELRGHHVQRKSRSGSPCAPHAVYLSAGYRVALPAPEQVVNLRSMVLGVRKVCLSAAT